MKNLNVRGLVNRFRAPVYSVWVSGHSEHFEKL
jgi:hypothetical protein